jgi:N-ethylmaleimide reductase
MSILIFITGHYHYLRQLSTNDKAFPEGFKVTLRQEMTVEDIKTTVKDFQNAAINAVKAGFDGVEIHSSKFVVSSLTFNG